MWKDHALEDPARLRETEEGVMPLEAPRAERMLAAVSDAGRLRRAL
jgi:hypothetical protein